MKDEEVTLIVTDERSTDSERLENATLSLRDELLTIEGARDIEPRGLAAPPLSKGGTELVGTIAMALPAAMPALRELRLILRDWLHRNDGKKVQIKVKGVDVEVTGLNDDLLERILGQGMISDAE